MSDKPLIEKTVIVLGAGASAPYGFPTGDALIKSILEHEQDGRLYIAPSQAGPGGSEVFRFDNATNLLDAMQVSELEERNKLETWVHRNNIIRGNHFGFLQGFFSGLKLYRNSQIDYFLRSHAKYRKIGKSFIAREILDKERSARDKILNHNFRPREDWIGSLFASLLQKAKNLEDLKTIAQNLTIITFNYDLVFEYYLDQFCRGDDEWGRALEEFKKSLKIIHIYGKLGRFEWENEDALRKIYEDEMVKSFAVRTDQDFGSCFNQGCNYSRISELAEGIRVIGGDKHQNVNLRHIRAASGAILAARKVFFFGFGFDQNNLSLLGCTRESFKGRHVFYTIYDEDEGEKIEMVINDSIKNLKHVDESLVTNPHYADQYGIYKRVQKIESLLIQI